MHCFDVRLIHSLLLGLLLGFFSPFVMFVLGLVMTEAFKCAYIPSFLHLLLLLTGIVRVILLNSTVHRNALSSH